MCTRNTKYGRRGNFFTKATLQKNKLPHIHSLTSPVLAMMSSGGSHTPGPLFWPGQI